MNRFYLLPLAANNRGYYLINTKTEYDEYIKNLDSRIAGIEERKKIITDNYNPLYVLVITKSSTHFLTKSLSINLMASLRFVTCE